MGKPGFAYIKDVNNTCWLDAEGNLLCPDYGALSFPSWDDFERFVRAVNAIYRALQGIETEEVEEWGPKEKELVEEEVRI